MLLSVNRVTVICDKQVKVSGWRRIPAIFPVSRFWRAGGPFKRREGMC